MQYLRHKIIRYQSFTNFYEKEQTAILPFFPHHAEHTSAKRQNYHQRRERDYHDFQHRSTHEKCVD